jgi:hypothetical protein
LLICCGTGIELGAGDATLGVELGDTVDIGWVSSVGASLGVAAVASLGFAVGPCVGSLESSSDGNDVGETLGSSVFAELWAELGPALLCIVGESLGWLLGSELCSAEGLEVAFTVVGKMHGALLASNKQ